MKRVIVAKSITKNLDIQTDSLLQEFMRITGQITEEDIIEFGNSFWPDDFKELRSVFRELRVACRQLGLDYAAAAKEDKDVADLVHEIVAIVKGE